ncbi:MAG: DJ-1/PfpI family protein [Chloroflexi bacterium]|nr:DJ-1/PfpI family protein [Chloroflexota bacterium]
MEIAILLYEGVTALDAIGPHEVFRLVPGATVRFVATERGPKRADGSFLSLIAEHTLDEVPTPDILVVPGATNPAALLNDRHALDWIRAAHEHSTWTSSVCTGALGLGAAGILQGKAATTHWLALESLSNFGATPTHERVVRDGKIVTGAGVSAGIDMALTLTGWAFGKEVAQQIQLMIEYDPQPPFDAGSPDTAPKKIVQQVIDFYSN